MRLGVFAIVFAAAIAVGLAPAPAWAAKHAKQAKAAAKSPKKATKVKPSKSRLVVASISRKPVAIAAPQPLALSDVQLVLASMVQTGRAECEFQQTVMVEPNLEQLGGFVVRFQDAAYKMVPEQTTTGAIRLVDNKAGVGWLQIRYKSMLMNTRATQRMVDACSMPTQRLAEAEAERLLRAAAEPTDPASPDTVAPLKELPLLSN